MGYLQFNVMEHDKLLEKHAAALGLKDVKIVWATFNGPDAMNNALISDSIDIVAGGVPGLLTLWNRTRRHRERGAGHFGAVVAAVPAEHAQRQHQVDRRPEGLGPHRGAGREGLGAGGGLADGGRQAVRREELRQVRPAHRVDVAAGLDHRAALGLGRDQQRVRRAAVPAAATGEARHPHHPQFVRHDGRPAHLHGGVDERPLPREESGALQGADRRAEGGDRHRRQGPREGGRLLDRGREIEAAAREGDGGDLRPAGEVDHGRR